MSETPTGLLGEGPVPPIGEITRFSADTLERSLRAEFSVKLPEGTVAILTVGVKESQGRTSYHEVGGAVIGEEILAIAVRASGKEAEFSGLPSVDFSPVSETWFDVTRLRIERQPRLSMLIEAAKSKFEIENIDPYKWYLITQEISKQDPQLISETTSLGVTLKLIEEKTARQTLSKTRLEKPLSDLNIKPDDVVYVSFRVATDRMVEIETGWEK